jgi:hypothetical protein
MINDGRDAELTQAGGESLSAIWTLPRGFGGPQLSNCSLQTSLMQSGRKSFRSEKTAERVLRETPSCVLPPGVLLTIFGDRRPHAPREGSLLTRSVRSTIITPDSRQKKVIRLSEF